MSFPAILYLIHQTKRIGCPTHSCLVIVLQEVCYSVLCIIAVLNFVARDKVESERLGRSLPFQLKLMTCIEKILLNCYEAK